MSSSAGICTSWFLSLVLASTLGRPYGPWVAGSAALLTVRLPLHGMYSWIWIRQGSPSIRYYFLNPRSSLPIYVHELCLSIINLLFPKPYLLSVLTFMIIHVSIPESLPPIFGKVALFKDKESCNYYTVCLERKGC